MNAIRYKMYFFIFFIAISLITGCESENLSLDAGRHKEIVSKKITLDELSSYGNALEKLTPFIYDKSPNNTQRLTYYAEFGFYVDVDEIIMKQSGDNISFTLPVYREGTGTKTENLVLSLTLDNKYLVSLMKYNLTDIDKQAILNNSEVFDLNDKTEVQLLIDADFPLAAKGTGGPYEGIIFKADDGTCFRVNHTWMEDGILKWNYINCACPPEEHSDQTYTEDGHGGGGYPPAVPVWYPIPVSGGGGNGPATAGGNGPSGGGGTGHSVLPPIITSPLLDLIRTIDCAKINSILNLGTHRQDLVDLATHVTDPVNEFGFGYNDSDTKIDFTPAPAVNPTAATKFKSLNHIHNSPPGGTLSIFSDSDITTIAELLKNENIDPSNFISTLSTSKGTHYVLTISNAGKFRDFFYFILHDYADPATNAVLYGNSYAKFRDLQIKYFGKQTGFIRPVNSNNPFVMSMFIDFLEEANMGVTLFEANADFTDFAKVSKDSKGKVVKKNCN